MPAEPRSKKSSTPAESQPSEALPDPDGFLSELDTWGVKPNPASFEKLLETNHQKFAKALSQGYSAEDVCRLAASYGIQIKTSTFRKYWQKLNTKRSSETLPETSSAPNSRQASTKSSTRPDSPASTTASSAVNF